MKKFHVMRGVLLGVAIAASSPTVVKAEETGLTTKVSEWWDELTTDENKEKAKEKASEIWNGLVDFSREADEKINENVIDPIKEQISSTNMFKKDSLWLIEKKGELETEESRYFFVNKNIPTIHKIYYYDKYGNEVDESSLEAVTKLDKEMFISVTNVSDDAFLKMIYKDVKTESIYVNFQDYVDGNLEYSIENASLGEFDKQYIRYQDWTELFNLDPTQEKISVDELKDCLNELEKKENTLSRRR